MTPHEKGLNLTKLLFTSLFRFFSFQVYRWVDEQTPDGENKVYILNINISLFVICFEIIRNSIIFPSLDFVLFPSFMIAWCEMLSGEIEN